MDCPSSQNRIEDLDSYVWLVNSCPFPFAKPWSHLLQKSSLFVSKLLLLLPFLGAPVSQMQPSHGILMSKTQSLPRVEFWLHTLADQQRGGSVKISSPFGNSIIILWMESYGIKSVPDWEVGGLSAPAVSASTLAVACHVSLDSVFSSLTWGGWARWFLQTLPALVFCGSTTDREQGWRISQRELLPLRPLPPIPAVSLELAWPCLAWGHHCAISVEVLGEGGLRPAGGRPTGVFFSDAYVPSQAALSELWTMCSFCPQLFQPPVHSLCICCHTGHPGWQATTRTHCAPLMKHGLVIWGWLGACKG